MYNVKLESKVHIFYCLNNSLYSMMHEYPHIAFGIKQISHSLQAYSPQDIRVVEQAQSKLSI